MRTYECVCGATLFFDSTRCVTCGREVGWCGACRAVTSISAAGQCQREGCGQALGACFNRRQYAVCNAFVPSNQDGRLCSSCLKTLVIPDTNREDHVRQWRDMESGKRRLLYDLELVGLTEQELEADPPLRFRFMADTPAEHIVTGHADGVITINLAEADPVVREQGRRQFNEPQRTIIGHLRHEVSHFIWMRLLPGRRDDEARSHFGDHELDYQVALQRYYDQGPPPDWPQQYISQYASSHPWEDFAETAAFYLDMRAVLDTLAFQLPAFAPSPPANFDKLLATYQSAGIVLNEVNRTMGLTDVVPEVLCNPVVEKLRFVHGLLSGE